ncbi:MAG: integrase core domain-containing protein [Planctomycetota bacterium]
MLLRNEYLTADNRILRAKIRGRLLLTDPEHATLARIGKRLGQIARNVTMEDWGFLRRSRLLIHDRDSKFCARFRAVLRSGGVRSVRLPVRSPNLNAFAEPWVRSVKQECLSRLVLFGESSLRRALDQYLAHYHHERNHQGKGNALLEPRRADRVGASAGPIDRRKRLGGLLKFYCRRAA